MFLLVRLRSRNGHTHVRIVGPVSETMVKAVRDDGTITDGKSTNEDFGWVRFSNASHINVVAGEHGSVSSAYASHHKPDKLSNQLS